MATPISMRSLQIALKVALASEPRVFVASWGRSQSYESPRDTRERVGWPATFR